jgi:hypothetical protein
MDSITPEYGRNDYYGISDDTDNECKLKIIYLGNKDDYPECSNGNVWEYKINGTEKMDHNTESGILKYMTGEELHLFVSEIVFSMKHMGDFVDG